jgi:hypothetical protein
MMTDRERIARVLLERRGFGFYEDPMEGGQDAYDLTLEALVEADAVIATLAQPVAAVGDERERRFMIVDSILMRQWPDQPTAQIAFEIVDALRAVQPDEARLMELAQFLARRWKVTPADCVDGLCEHHVAVFNAQEQGR